LLLGLARAQVGLGKFVEANENYQRIIREGVPAGAPGSFRMALQDAQREIKAVTPKLAWVTVTLKEPAAGVVTVDGVELPKAAMDVKRAFNPGSHVLKASADGYRPTTTTIDVKEGESKAVTLALDAAQGSAPATTATTPAPETDPGAPVASADVSATASPAGSRQRTFGFIGLGVGGVGLVVGGIAGLVAVGRHSTLETECPTGKCAPSGQTTIDSFRSMATVSTMGFVIGGLFAAGGGVLLLTAPREQQTGVVRPYVGLGNAGVRVTF
jgi:hypothetical protein